MFHREAGNFKTTYATDMALFPLPITRWTAAFLAVLFIVIVPLSLHEYYLSVFNLVFIAIVGALGLFTHLVESGLALVSGGHFRPKHHGMVDTSPLRSFLGRALQAKDGELVGVAENLGQNRVRAVAVTAASYTTGRSVTFVQGRYQLSWDVRSDGPRQPGGTAPGS